MALATAAALAVTVLSPTVALASTSDPESVTPDGEIINVDRNQDRPTNGISGNWTGSSVPSAETPIVPDTQQARDKMALTMAWEKAVKGEIPASDYLAAEQKYHTSYDLPLPTRTLSNDVSALAAPSSRTLSLTHAPQINGYFCGPATGTMMIKMADGGIRSKATGESFGQTNLGNASHMRTSINKVTDWGSKLFVTGINKWRGTNYYVQVNSPSLSVFKAAIKNSIGSNGMPLAADTVEFQGGAHYNNHPNRTIGHWITAYGYTGNGDTVKWADPSTNLWSSNGVKATFTYSASGFAQFLKSNGIAY
ncbi:C39 family peptidase [Sphaerimonospora thailandensis]|uniref:Peptidase C39-like domain-containing protein n=1 Tax=Sphaerimonospora thailandensis TaxID=795644 RepID=A0A8J3VYQ9_9ACTN|nr:C39 family peptidase [Sphaerimonospora thailandensis]GIH69151.1 hypothetical protein Mth01_14040 [Sphaerimonospora thailandensis]